MIDQGLYSYKNKLVGQMTYTHKKERLRWCREYEHYTADDWSKYLITDSKIWRLDGGMNRQNQRTNLYKGDTANIRKFEKRKGGPTVHAYGGISSLGLTKLIPIKGYDSSNSNQIHKVINVNKYLSARLLYAPRCQC
eukprot:184068_1